MAVVVVCVAVGAGVGAAPASAFNPIKTFCGVAGLASGLLGKACDVAENPGRILGAGKQILGGHIAGAVKAVLGEGGAAASGVKAALSLAAIGAWVLGGARFALHETAKVLSEKTSPDLRTSWFSATYWRMAGIASLLTMPFLFAAAIQALVRSDMTLLLRTILGYLPLAMLVVSVAAPVTMLLLSASDELSALVSSAAGSPGSRALGLGGALAGGLSALTGSPFLIVFLGLLTVAGAIALWMEMLMREAAVYVVVLMLPLAFAAFVWPARRTWAIRALEVLVALILSKFAIVAVLSLGGAAMDQIGHSITAPVLGLVLVAMGAFAPWALLRLVPLAELAGAAMESLRGQGRAVAGRTEYPYAAALGADEWATTTTAEMRRAAEDVEPPSPPRTASDQRVGDLRAVDRPASDTAHAGGDNASSDAESAGGEPPAPRASAEEGAGSAPGVRLPGLPDMWQADDLSWKPLVLGREEGWPPRVWPAAEDGTEEPPTGEGLPPLDEFPSATDSSGFTPATDPAEPPPGVDPSHPDPLPPAA